MKFGPGALLVAPIDTYWPVCAVRTLPGAREAIMVDPWPGMTEGTGWTVVESLLGIEIDMETHAVRADADMEALVDYALNRQARPGAELQVAYETADHQQRVLGMRLTGTREIVTTDRFQWFTAGRMAP